MLFYATLLISNILANRQSNENEFVEINCCFSDSSDSSSEFICKPSVRPMEIECVNERPNECKKCLGIFQQIEYLIVRNNNVDVKAVKDNFNEMTKAIVDVLRKSNENHTKYSLDHKAHLVKFVVENARKYANASFSAFDKYLAVQLDSFKESSSKFVSTALTNYGSSLNSILRLSPGEIVVEINNLNGSFNTTVLSIISDVTLGHSSVFNSMVKDSRKTLDKVFPIFRHEVSELLSNESEKEVGTLSTLIKTNKNEIIQTIDHIICKYRDLLINSLENFNFRLFEVVKFLLDLCREEITGEKGKSFTSYRYPMLLPSWNNNSLFN